MPDLVRQEVATQCRTVVVKVGTRVLTAPDGTLNEERIAQLAHEMHQIRQTGRNAVLVSSGAVGAGMHQLKLKQRPSGLAKLQAVAAVGQTKLIEAYDRTFRQHGYHAAQVLLTGEDLNDRRRYLNVRNTLLELDKLQAIPVVNENDTVAVDELMPTFGDNDRLAAMVTCLFREALLVILSDVDGLYDGDPRSDNSTLLSTVTDIDDTILSYIQDQQSSYSKGGMATKIEAARVATNAGENVIIASGRQGGVLEAILAGEQLGTLFIAKKTVRPWKRWLGFSTQPQGQILLDAGACQAIRTGGCSLLAIGIVEVRGAFEKGDVVEICDQQGEEIGRGLINYSAADTKRILGLPSSRIEQVLGHRPYDEVIHCDNLTIFENGG